MVDAIHASRAATAMPGINRGWMLALGIFLLVLGVIGLGMTYVLAATVLFWSGILAMVAGVGHLLDAYHHKAWRGVIWHVAIGAIYILVGFMFLAMPSASIIFLMTFIALALVLTGLLRLTIMFKSGVNRGLRVMLLISAIVSIGLGLYIFQLVGSPDPAVFASPEAHAAWVRSLKSLVGLFFAIELITEGMALISISMSGASARGN